ncbi:adenosine receptor A1-like [Ptychodera flava]|uniref:adenosine receptor A1-like n=1 Tax=Ptychodera flava TaxID=63121 RepID=UPI00396A4328
MATTEDMQSNASITVGFTENLDSVVNGTQLPETVYQVRVGLSVIILCMCLYDVIVCSLSLSAFIANSHLRHVGGYMHGNVEAACILSALVTVPLLLAILNTGTLHDYWVCVIGYCFLVLSLTAITASMLLYVLLVNFQFRRPFDSVRLSLIKPAIVVSVIVWLVVVVFSFIPAMGVNRYRDKRDEVDFKCTPLGVPTMGYFCVFMYGILIPFQVAAHTSGLLLLRLLKRTFVNSNIAGGSATARSTNTQKQLALLFHLSMSILIIAWLPMIIILNVSYFNPSLWDGYNVLLVVTFLTAIYSAGPTVCLLRITEIRTTMRQLLTCHYCFNCCH